MSKENAGLAAREELSGIVRAFQEASVAIFKQTRGHLYHDYNSQTFATLVVKPVPHIRKLLSADKELIVIFSAREDQFVSTIEFAIETIDASEGRLDHSIVVITHKDPDGSAQLVEWGAAKGLTVLPLFVKNGVPSGDELERLMFQQFYSQNPFEVTGPVHEDGIFYGRRSEAVELARQLQAGQVRACFGIRKSGKTSVINRAVHELRYEHESLVVMVDCSRDAVWGMDSGQLLEAVARAIPLAGLSSERYANVQAVTESVSAAQGNEHILDAMAGLQLPLILIFDEYDYLTPTSPTAQQWRTEFNIFWRNLRASYQEMRRINKMFSIVVSGVSSKWFRVAEINGIENAALGFVPEEYLRPLAVETANQMIAELGRSAGLHFDEENTVPVLAIASGMPFWLRKAGSFIHNSIDQQTRPRRPAHREIENLVATFSETDGIQIALSSIGHLFKVYPDLIDSARACHENRINECSQEHRRLLHRYGLTDSQGIISGTLIKNALQLYFDTDSKLPSAQGDVSGEPSLTAPEHKWAEELAQIGKSRNLIELKLREIILSALRYDSLTNKKAAAKDRLLAAVEDKRRVQLTRFEAAEILEKYYWLELIQLVDREWTLFEGLFADKAKFKDYGLIINERPDAHAKKVDPIDIAYYRRALTWFEEKLAKI